MPFGFGASTTDSSSSSSSFDTSSSRSGSGGASVAQSQDTIAFEDIFARMFGGAEGAAGGLDPSMLTEAANSLFTSGSGFMQGISGNAGNQYMTDRLSGDNQVLEDQIGLLGEDLGSFFNEQLMPGITSEAVGGGQLGGGRQGVAQGRAISEIGDQFTRGATALRAGDIGARDAVAGSIAGNAIGGAQVGFQGAGTMAGIADMGFGANLAPYERLAGIIGGPTVLGSSSASSADWAAAWANSFGQSQAETTSSGRSFGFTPG